MRNDILKAGALAMLCAGVSTQVAAQGFTGAALEMLKEQKLWFHTTNAAGAALDDTTNYSTLTIAHSQLKGNFHRPQQGNRQKSTTIGTEGFLNLGNAYVWGEFNFEQRNVTDAQFNASITDPYRGMPFIMADDHKSEWRNQYYDMKFRVATPLVKQGLFEGLGLGLEGVYKATLAAKQLDPRVDTRYFQLDINPGLVYQFDKNSTVGLNLLYSTMKEDSRMSNVNATVAQTYYLLYGLGVAAQQIGDGERLDYHGYKLGYGIQWEERWGNLQLLISGDQSRRVENFDRDPETPKKDASVNDNLITSKIEGIIHGDTFNHHFTIDQSSRDLKGIQYVNKFDNTESFQGWQDIYHAVRSTYKTRTVAVDYSLIRNRGNEYAWRVDAGVAYAKQDDKYLLPASAMKYDNLYMTLGGSYNFELGKTLRRRLLISAKGGYNANLSGSYTYGGVNPDYPTVTALTQGELNYFTTDYCRGNISAEYSQQYSQSQKMNFFARAALDYANASGDLFGHRRDLTFTVGVNF